MLRKLVDYKKLDHNLAVQLIENYPYGYGDEDIIIFKNLNGEIVETVELRTEDTIFLVKISKSLSNFIANFEENLEKGINSNTSTVLEGVETEKLELNFNEEESKS